MEPRSTAPRYVIVTVADANFLPAACCTLISTKDRSPTNGDTRRLLLAVDVPAEQATMADQFLQSRGLEASIECISSNDYFSNQMETDERFPVATYGRLILDSLIDPAVEKVLYLDADTRVMSSLAPLFDTDLGKHTLAAARDIYAYVQDRLTDVNARLGLPSDTDYFNAGVILLDWPATLESGLLQKARTFALHNPDRCEGHDQDALNAVIAGDFKPLDPRWNLYHYYFENGGTADAWIKHYTGPKPWSRKRTPVWAADAQWYRDILATSPWPDFVENQSWADQLDVRWHRARRWLRDYERVAGLYLAPFLLSAGTRKRASQYMSFDPLQVVKVTHSWMDDNAAGAN